MTEKQKKRDKGKTFAALVPNLLNPGRKNNVYVGKIDLERCYVQEWYLLWNLRDDFEILNGLKESFKETFGEPLTFTKFYQFIKKKKQFIFQWNIPDTYCLCKIYENATLMAKAIRIEKKAIQQHYVISSKIIVRFQQCKLH